MKINKEWCWKLFKNVVKATIIMAVVGAAVGAAGPLLAAGINATGLLATNIEIAGGLVNILEKGAVFGAFGAFSALVTPAVNYIFGERPHKTVTAKTLGVRSKSLGYEQAPDVSAAHAHTAAHDPSIAATQLASASPTHFQDIVMASRAGLGPKSVA